MTADALDVILRLQNVRAFQAGMHQAAGSVREVGAAADMTNRKSVAASNRAIGMMGLLRKATKVTAIAMIATGFEAYKMGTRFDTEMLKIQTEAGGGYREMMRMKQGVHELVQSGRAMGADPQSLAMGLYHIESLGFRGAKALGALEQAARLSAISGADLEETTSALGAALFVGTKGTGDLNHVTALLNATVGQGNMRMSELVHALGTGVLGSAKTAGLSIQDVMAALAVFSDSGQKASSAAAQFATALHFLYAPTPKAQEALMAIGLTQDNLANDLRGPNGMVTALKDLKEHLAGLDDNEAARVLNAIFPGGRGRVLNTELQLLDRAQQKWELINRESTGEKWMEHVRAQKENPATRLATEFAKVKDDLIQTYDTYKGPMTDLLVDILKLADATVKVIGPMAGFLVNHKELLFILIAAWGAYKTAMIIAFVAERAQIAATSYMMGRMMLMQGAEGGVLAAEAGAAGTTVGKAFATKMGLAVAAGIAGWEIGTWLRKHVINPMEEEGQKKLDKKANNILQQQVNHNKRLHGQFEHFQGTSGGRGGYDMLSWQQRLRRDPHEKTYQRHRDAEQHYTNSIFGMRPRGHGSAVEPVNGYKGASGSIKTAEHVTVAKGSVFRPRIEVPVYLQRREIARAVADDALERQSHR